MKKKIISTITRQLSCDKEKLWEVITDLENYQWRSDLSRIERIDDNHFIEYTKNDFATHFTITSKETLLKYSFTMENANMKGFWVGDFKVLEDKTVEITFTEEVEVRSFIMRLFAKKYLERQQRRYIRDLEKEVYKPVSEVR